MLEYRIINFKGGKMLKKVFILLVVLFSINIWGSRNINVTTPDLSQKSTLSQRIGITDISLIYYSPEVKKRAIWGKLIPYGKVWRAGANENTVIRFTHDVKVEGQMIKAGTYGLHMIPEKDQWTIIFSKNYTSWGSYFYKKDEDVLRVKVKPVVSELQEWLTYDFNDRKADSAILALSWEKVRVPIKIEVDVKKIMVDNIRKELRSLPFWYWKGTYGAAKYCFDNGVNLEEALKWIDKSINTEENFQNVFLKSKILNKLNKPSDAAKAKKHAFKIASENDMTQHAYSFASKDKEKCVSILLKNTKRYKTWTSYRALARLYNYTKEKKNAIKYFKLALKKAPKDKKKQLIDIIGKIK